MTRPTARSAAPSPVRPSARIAAFQALAAAHEARGAIIAPTGVKRKVSVAALSPRKKSTAGSGSEDEDEYDDLSSEYQPSQQLSSPSSDKRKSPTPSEDDEEEEEEPAQKKPTPASRSTARKPAAPRKTASPKKLSNAPTSFKPLLAHKYDPDFSPDPTGWWLSEKLDGVRALWHGSIGQFLSREGNRFYAPDWFTKRLPRGDIILDGELFTKRGGFQDCVGIVRSQNQPKRWKFSVTYQIFDVPSIDKGFEERMKWLEDNMKGFKSSRWVDVVEHVKCTGRKDLDDRLEVMIKIGGEGLMIREPGSRYVNGRSKTLLKAKKFLDADAVVRGYEQGQGKNANCTGALRVEMLSGGKPTGKMFKIGTGLTDKQRRNPPKIGAIVVYRYQELSKSGTPRFPSYAGERAD
jgi:DNA ligase-1